MAKTEKENKVQQLTEKLEQGIKDVFESENYKDFLKFMSKFHNYSYGNTLLILMQKPEASLVAGYKTWQNKFKRQVKRGERGIAILAPAPYKTVKTVEKIDPDTKKPILDQDGKPVLEEREVTYCKFKVVHVFDISQTEGEPVPFIEDELTGDVANYDLLFESLRSVSPFPIFFEEIQGMAKGYCSPKERKIVLRPGMDQAQNIKTAIHEITHADLHAEDALTMAKRDRNTEEVQAESVAFIVCSHYGIDASDYSFNYLANWSSGKELKELKQSLDTIQRQAADLIDRIDKKFFELQQEYQRRQNETLDTVRFDNDIDLDKEKTREQLGFNDKESIASRITSAQEAAKQQGEPVRGPKTKEREAR